MVVIASYVLLAGLLAFAGLAKAVDLRSLTHTLERLGVRPSWTGLTAVGVVIAECAAVVGLMVSPSQTWPRVLVTALFTAFAAAGVRGLLTPQRIPCHCFGAARPGRQRGLLGWRQVAMLPACLLIITLASHNPPAWNTRQGLLGLAALLTVLACSKIPVNLRLWRRLRGDRIALEESVSPPYSTAARRRVVFR